MVLDIPKGSINPWRDDERSQEIPAWEDNKHDTPFSALASLLNKWPGYVQTASCSSEVRHQRLVEIIAGYPEIFSGRRPLDIPFHPESELALQLSLFLDKITAPDETNWHSLRTYLLYHDLHQKEEEVGFLHELMSRIRNHSVYVDNGKRREYEQSKLHKDEVAFLTALHSQSTSRIDKFWPFKENELDFKRFPKQSHALKIKDSSTTRSYHEHEFRFEKIQTWIRQWTCAEQSGIPWLSENSSQKLIIGASTMLESIFAKMRSFILKERRPGSIIIDGGGRIRYMSKKTHEEEKEWYKKLILNVLMLNPLHPHPYQELIKTSLSDYSKHSFRKIKKRFAEDNEQFYFTNLFTPTEELRLTSEGFTELIGPERMKHFLPDIVAGWETDPDRPEYLIDRSKKDSWYSKTCVLCCNKTREVPLCSNPECQQEEKGQAQHFKNDKDSCKCITCQKVLLKKYSTPTEILRQNDDVFVCPFHNLIFKMGEEATLRQKSRGDLLKVQPMRLKSGEKKITHMIMFDGNSIGSLFLKDFPLWSNLDGNRPIWAKIKDKVRDLNFDFNALEIDQYKECFEDDLLFYRFVEKVRTKRMEVLIRKQRRSFNFNAEWWMGLRKAIKGTEDVSLVPWVMAGDDLVFVNHQPTNDESALAMLKEFDTNLKKAFPENTTVTFAGSMQKRENNTLVKTYYKARKLEELASLAWKSHILDQEPELISEDKKIKMIEELENDPQLRHDVNTLKEHINTFSFGNDATRIPSILIPNDWEQKIEN